MSINRIAETAASVINAVADTRDRVAAKTAATESATTDGKAKVDSTAFMSLLVAQLKNQDPLAPQDGAQFLAQLASFNQLEQLMSINDRLGQLLGK